MTKDNMLKHRVEMGEAGDFPFTRGIHPHMYQKQLWTMRQYAGFGTAQESNARLHMLCNQGQTGLSVAFDLPTQMGYDSDDPLALGEVGKTGVAIDTVEDMRTLLKGLALDKISTSMTINATAAILLAMYVLVAEEQGVAASALRGTVQNDLLKEYAARGTYIFPIRPSLRITRDILAWCNEHAPKWNPISVSGYHMREAGSTAAQEIAFTLAHGKTYVELGLSAGLSPDDIGRRISFFFNAHNGFIEEVAKFRAARTIWASLMRDHFKATDPRAMQLRFHAQTGGSTLQAQQPLNNVARTTIQALSAVLGGCQSLHVNAYDEALALPSEGSALLALRTQQIIAHESGVTAFVDPLGGSFSLEEKTQGLVEEARTLMASIDEQGGAVAAIESGFIQNQIADAAYAYQMDVERSESIIVGVNQYKADETVKIKLQDIDPKLELDQKERLKNYKAQREPKALESATSALARAAGSDANLMPFILAGLKSKLTLGEICKTLRSAFGDYRSA